LRPAQTVNEPILIPPVGNDVAIRVQTHSNTSWLVRYEANSFP